MTRLFWGLVAFGFAVVLTGSARGDYTFTPLDVPGATYTFPHGINDSGQIVGFYGTDGTSHGFLLSSDGVYTTFDVPDATGTVAYGINNAGQIVGSYSDADGGSHGFLRSSDGAYTTLDVPGAVFTNAYGINDSGHIVGQYYNGGGFAGFRGFELNDEIYTCFSAIGYATWLTGINTTGFWVGYFTDEDGGYHPFYGGLTTFDVPGGLYASAFGINDSWDIVGSYAQPDPYYHGYLRSGDGDYTSLDVPDAQNTYAFGINNYGVIVGGFSDQQGHGHGFVAMPQ